MPRVAVPKEIEKYLALDRYTIHGVNIFSFVTSQNVSINMSSSSTVTCYQFTLAFERITRSLMGA